MLFRGQLTRCGRPDPPIRRSNLSPPPAATTTALRRRRGLEPFLHQVADDIAIKHRVNMQHPAWDQVMKPAARSARNYLMLLACPFPAGRGIALRLRNWCPIGGRGISIRSTCASAAL